MTWGETARPLAISAGAPGFVAVGPRWFRSHDEPAPTGRPAGSLAWAGIQNTFFWIDPTNGIGGVHMVQILPFVDEKALANFYDFETAVYHAVS